MKTDCRTIMRIAAASAFAFAVSLTPGTAQIATPAGCTAVATAHRNSCVTTTVFTCEMGYQTHTYVSGQPEGVHFYSDDWVIQGFRSDDIEIARIDTPPLTNQREALFTKGWHAEEGNFALNTKIIKNRVYTLSGETTLGIETVTLNGQEFRRGYFTRLFAPNAGSAGLSFEAELLVSPDFDMVFEGIWSRSAFGSDPERFDHDVRAVYRTGDAGFMAAQSDFGCE